MSTLLSKLENFVDHNRNVMFIGKHGVGKSSVFFELTKKKNLKAKYYSSPTLDPWIDVVGLPKPNEETGDLDFFQKKDMKEAEILFFDELNRAHPRVLNAVLEIIQFGTINGDPFPNLRCVWAAINPPGGDYQVEDLDPALVDRFHAYINMPANIDMQYMKTVMNESTAKVLSAWWHDDLSDEHRNYITPRRIEYMGYMIDNNLSWKDSVPKSSEITFPIRDLENRMNMVSSDNEIITKEDIVTNPDKYLKQMDSDPTVSIKIKNHMIKFNVEELYTTRDVLESLPPDMISDIANKKFPDMRNKLKEYYEENNCSFDDYPQTSKAWGWQEQSA